MYIFNFSPFSFIIILQKLINHVNKYGHANTYAYSMSPPVIQQILSSMQIIMGIKGGNEGKNRIDTLSRNTR